MYMSPSTRRAWIEITVLRILAAMLLVALHPEGVDRNNLWSAVSTVILSVALHPEGVDRNRLQAMFTQHTWVALHPEGVDRNIASRLLSSAKISRPPPGGRG